jgi:anti-anti-sigma regulatory factor
MRLPEEALALAVENPAEGIVAVRVAGQMNRVTVPRLLRLLDSLIHRNSETARSLMPELPTSDGRAHVIVDLAGVGHFGTGGLDALRHSRHAAEQAGVKLHLTGLSARTGLLPLWVATQIMEFDALPTLEDAVAAFGESLAGAT